MRARCRAVSSLPSQRASSPLRGYSQGQNIGVHALVCMTCMR